MPRDPAQQRGDAVADELAHDERGAGALDAGDRQDVPGDAVQVVGVGGGDVHQQVRLPADPVNLQDLGDARERRGDVVKPPLGDLGGDVSGERVAEDRGRDLALQRVEHAALLQPGEPGLNGVARQPGLVRQRDGRGAWLPDQGEEQPGVGRINAVPVAHNAHLRFGNAARTCAVCSV